MTVGLRNPAFGFGLRLSPSVALTIEGPMFENVAGVKGIEPLTIGLVNRCSCSELPESFR